MSTPGKARRNAIPTLNITVNVDGSLKDVGCDRVGCVFWRGFVITGNDGDIATFKVCVKKANIMSAILHDCEHHHGETISKFVFVILVFKKFRNYLIIQSRGEVVLSKTMPM